MIYRIGDAIRSIDANEIFYAVSYFEKIVLNCTEVSGGHFEHQGLISHTTIHKTNTSAHIHTYRKEGMESLNTVEVMNHRVPYLYWCHT